MTVKTLKERLADCQSLQTIEGHGEIRKALESRRDAGEITLHQRKDDTDGVYLSKALPQPKDKAFDPKAIDAIKAAALAAGVQWDDDEFIEETRDGRRARALRFRASDERIDRAGDITRQDWRLDYFNRVGHILLGHDWSTQTLPLARAIQNDVEQKTDDDYNGPALMHTLLFPRRETYELGGQVYDLARLGLFNTMSVGYFPNRVIHVQDANERDKIGAGFSGYILEDNELVETSMVNVPANAGAIQEIAKVASVFADHSEELTADHFDLFRSTVTRSVDSDYREPIGATLRAIGLALYGKDYGPSDPDTGLTEHTATRLAELQSSVSSLQKISTDFLAVHKQTRGRADSQEARIKAIEQSIAKMTTRIDNFIGKAEAEQALKAAKEQAARAREIAQLAAEGCLVLDFPGKTEDSKVGAAPESAPAKARKGQTQDGALGLAYLMGG